MCCTCNAYVSCLVKVWLWRCFFRFFFDAKKKCICLSIVFLKKDSSNCNVSFLLINLENGDDPFGPRDEISFPWDLCVTANSLYAVLPWNSKEGLS